MLGQLAHWHFEDDPKAAIYIPAYWTAWNSTLLGYFNTIISTAQAHPTMTFLVAANINNGPGSAAPSPTDTTYLKIQEMLAQPNIVVIGYVGTNYGSELTKAEYPPGNPFPGTAPRDLQSVKNDCTNWVNWYHVRGFMFDDQASGLTISDVPGYPGGVKEVYNAFYTPLVAHARSLAGVIVLKGNPGTTPNSSYYNLFDIEAVFEGSALPTLSQLQTRTNNGALRNRTAYVTHTEPDADTNQMGDPIATYTRYFWCVDINGYSKLPPYFEAMVSELDAVGQAVGAGYSVAIPTNDSQYGVTGTTASRLVGAIAGTTVWSEYFPTGSAGIGRTFNKITMLLRKEGTLNASDVLTFGTFDASGNVVTTFGTLTAGDITTTDANYAVTLSTPYTIQAGDRIGFKFTGGASNIDGIRGYEDTANPFDSTVSFRQRWDGAAWQQNTAADANMALDFVGTAESVTITDSVARRGVITAGSLGTQSTTVGAGTVAISQVLSRSLATETTSVADAVARVLASGRSGSESTSVSEGFGNTPVLFRSPQETTDISEALAAGVVASRVPATETVEISDGVARGTAFAASLTESLDVADSGAEAEFDIDEYINPDFYTQTAMGSQATHGVALEEDAVIVVEATPEPAITLNINSQQADPPAPPPVVETPITSTDTTHGKSRNRLMSASELDKMFGLTKRKSRNYSYTDTLRSNLERMKDQRTDTPVAHYVSMAPESTAITEFPLYGFGMKSAKKERPSADRLGDSVEITEEIMIVRKLTPDNKRRAFAEALRMLEAIEAL